MENGGAAGRSGAAPWDFWELGSWPSSHVASSSSFTAAVPSHGAAAAPPSPPPCPSTSAAAATCLAFSDHQTVKGSGGNRLHHITCLKLGKRHYYEEESAGAAMKRERPPAAPRCQVEGCNKVLAEEKEYHRRHKVCELHSKAPKVVVLGVEQRFCQQCSRFHVVSEFDDSKRSCRRRLAGHNERRRKSSNDSITRNPSLERTMMTGGMFPYLTLPACALSLLSSKASPWISTPEFSARSSAALDELIAENRTTTLLARQLISDQGGGRHSVAAAKQPPFWPHQVTSQTSPQLGDGWSHLQEAGNSLTLDLMQMPSSSFEILSGRSKSKEEEDCCEIWKSLEGKPMWYEVSNLTSNV